VVAGTVKGSLVERRLVERRLGNGAGRGGAAAALGSLDSQKPFRSWICGLAGLTVGVSLAGDHSPNQGMNLEARRKRGRRHDGKIPSGRGTSRILAGYIALRSSSSRYALVPRNRHFLGSSAALPSADRP
jgi:hypothetical protein